MVQGHPPRAETQQGAIPLPPPRRIPGPMPRHSPTVLCPPGLWVLHVSRAGSSVPRYPRVPTLPSGVPMSPAQFPVSRCPSEPQAITALPVLLSSRGPLTASPCSHVPALLPVSGCPARPQANTPLPSLLLCPAARNLKIPRDPPRAPYPASRSSSPARAPVSRSPGSPEHYGPARPPRRAPALRAACCARPRCAPPPPSPLTGRLPGSAHVRLKRRGAR